MVRRADTPCASCGRLLFGGRGSLPPGEMTCRPCRAAGLGPRRKAVPCAGCGRPFFPRRAGAGRVVKTCSRRCGQIARHRAVSLIDRRRRAAERNHRKWAARRARKLNAAVVEVVAAREIFERDDWRCHLCGRRTKRGVGGMHPLGATLDHVLPLAAGGDHTRANLATAHRCCNIAKGARPLGQLALFG